MAFIINIDHDVDAVVYHLTVDCGIKESTVVKVLTETEVVSALSVTTVQYHLVYTGDLESTSILAESSNVYIDLVSAIAAYELTFV